MQNPDIFFQGFNSLDFEWKKTDIGPWNNEGTE